MPVPPIELLVKLLTVNVIACEMKKLKLAPLAPASVNVTPGGGGGLMCNLYGLKVKRWELIAHYQANDDFRREIEREEMAKDYVPPGREGWVVTQDDSGRHVAKMNWGFRPPAGVRAPVVNVRTYGSPFWRSALANPERRCLVPFNRFQEWSVEPDPLTGKKRPHWFSLPSRPIGTFAGVWRPTADGPRYAFLTCGYDGDAQAHVVGAIHPKAVR